MPQNAVLFQQGKLPFTWDILGDVFQVGLA